MSALRCEAFRAAAITALCSAAASIPPLSAGAAARTGTPMVLEYPCRSTKAPAMVTQRLAIGLCARGHRRRGRADGPEPAPRWRDARRRWTDSRGAPRAS